MMQIAGAVARFFSNSCKRQLALDKWVATILKGKAKEVGDVLDQMGGIP